MKIIGTCTECYGTIYIKPTFEYNDRIEVTVGQHKCETDPKQIKENKKYFEGTKRCVITKFKVNCSECYDFCQATVRKMHGIRK